MAYRGIDWQSKGFAHPPMLRVSTGAGLSLYRCWGERSRGVGSAEWGTGYFSLEKPRSVLEAEMMYNIVDWNNGVHFVSSFRLRPGFAYWLGAVAHGAADSYLPGWQVFVEGPIQSKIELIKSREVLHHNVFVGPRDGTA